MKRTPTFALALALALALTACTSTPQVRDTASAPAKVGGKGGLVLKNLLKAELEGVDDTEVIVSHVTIPPNTTLPKHWHPGEEFAYVLDGSVTLWQKGKRDQTIATGDVGKVPLKQIHTAVTGDESVTLLVFRVHEKGQPERVAAD